ncbi:hypothetical protein Brsp01_50960 [Brucella sp. NBRC 12950]|nr:hypothetical protein Brsp01_50960 [Brucella sp. NBRC 12950]
MPLHLLPRATKLNVKFIITSRGEIRKVLVHSNPSMPALDTWVKKKLESVKSITAPPSGKDERAGFSVKVAVTLE